MKKPILQNLVEMTGLRDHLRLEVSVLSTLQSISGITNIRALEIFAHDGETYLRPRTWLDQGQLLSSEMEGLHTNTRQPLSQYPALQECIDNQQISTMHSPRRGCHILWMPVWKNNRAGSCLEITQSRPFSLHRLEVILGIFQVYQNYQSLLDYSERDALTGLLTAKRLMNNWPATPVCHRFCQAAATPRPRAATPTSSGWRSSILTTSNRSTTVLVTSMAMKC